MARTKAASLADELVRSFEGRIQRGDMAPGDRFPTEMAVVADHGVSRTVVREAFARLAARGLLESRRGSGAYVARDARYTAFQIPPDQVQAVDDVLKLLEMRRGLEAEMAMLAAERRSDADLARMRACMTAMEESRDVDASIAADAAFHAAIAQATDNEYYARFTEFLGVRLVPSRRLYLQSDAPDQHRAYAHAINLDHAAIYRAIEAASPERARLAARRHMDKSAERYRSLKDDAAAR